MKKFIDFKSNSAEWDLNEKPDSYFNHLSQIKLNYTQTPISHITLISSWIFGFNPRRKHIHDFIQLVKTFDELKVIEFDLYVLHSAYARQMINEISSKCNGL